VYRGWGIRVFSARSSEFEYGPEAVRIRVKRIFSTIAKIFLRNVKREGLL
jgi:hypothetical protein